MDIKILHFRWSLQEAEDWRGGWGHVLGPRPLPQPLVLLPHPRQAEAQDHLHTGKTGVRVREFSNFQTAAQWRFCNKCPNSHVVCILFLCNPYELNIEVNTYIYFLKNTSHYFRNSYKNLRGPSPSRTTLTSTAGRSWPGPPSWTRPESRCGGCWCWHVFWFVPRPHKLWTAGQKFKVPMKVWMSLIKWIAGVCWVVGGGCCRPARPCVPTSVPPPPRGRNWTYHAPCSEWSEYRDTRGGGAAN